MPAAIPAIPERISQPTPATDVERHGERDDAIEQRVGAEQVDEHCHRRAGVGKHQEAEQDAQHAAQDWNPPVAYQLTDHCVLRLRVQWSADSRSCPAHSNA